MVDVATRYVPIDRYAVIGDCRSAALISNHGSLDWLCLPRFDSPSIFGALLDRDGGGSFTICPSNGFATRRRYLGDTNVLETWFRNDSGTARLVDLMPVDDEESDPPWPERSLIRMVEGMRRDGARRRLRPAPGLRPGRPAPREPGAVRDLLRVRSISAHA